MKMSTGQLSGALRTDGTFSGHRSEPSAPTLVLDQLALLVLFAAVAIGPAIRTADQFWLRAHHLLLCGSLHCRLVSHIYI